MHGFIHFCCCFWDRAITHIWYKTQQATIFYWNVLLVWQTWWLCPTLHLAGFIDSFLVYHSSNLRGLIITLRVFTKFLPGRTLPLSEAGLLSILQCIASSRAFQPLILQSLGPITFPLFTNWCLGSLSPETSAIVLFPSSLSGLLFMVCYI